MISDVPMREGGALWASQSSPGWFMPIQNVYFRAVELSVQIFRGIGCKMLARITAVNLTEFSSVLSAVYYKIYAFIIGLPHLNPSEITDEEAQVHATLFIHGDMHDPSAWIPFAKKFKEERVGPMYAVHLNSGMLVEDDRDLIEEKIEEIKAHYNSHGKEAIIDIVGHSRGTEYALLTGFTRNSARIEESVILWNEMTPREEVGRIIRIGTPTDQNLLSQIPEKVRNSLYEIDADFDLLVSERSTHFQKFTSDTGHLGLLYGLDVQEKTIQWLSASESNI